MKKFAAILTTVLLVSGSLVAQTFNDPSNFMLGIGGTVNVSTQEGVCATINNNKSQRMISILDRAKYLSRPKFIQ